jgi:hypothetical protein
MKVEMIGKYPTSLAAVALHSARFLAADLKRATAFSDRTVIGPRGTR